jgi:hypothetical protein
MAKNDRQQDQVKNVSGGGHLGGTRFGQVPGDAKEKLGPDGTKGDKARPNNGEH